jgi:hypothetical protein
VKAIAQASEGNLSIGIFVPSQTVSCDSVVSRLCPNPGF